MRGKKISEAVRSRVAGYIREGGTVPLAAERFGISKQTLYKAAWVKQAVAARYSDAADGKEVMTDEI